MYQPPEASLGRTATVQGDVYALGVLLYQVLVGNLAQTLGIGWERHLDAARARPPAADHSSGGLVLRLLREDIGDCVDGDPSARLASVAQLVERLQTLPKRVTDRQARQRAERAALRMYRLRIALAAAVAALVVVGGLGAIAFREWQRAETNKQAADEARKTAVENEQQAIREKKRAVENENRAKQSADMARQQAELALSTLNSVIFDIQDGLSRLPAGSEVRRRLLSTALERLERLSGEFVKKTAVDRNTAVALTKMGDLVLQFGEASSDRNAKQPSVPNDPRGSGAAQAALRLHARALAIREALAKADPNNAQAKRDLSVSYNKLGDVHLQLGATDKALQSYQKGLELSEALAKADPNDAQAKRDLSVSYNKLGDVHLKLGATDKGPASTTRRAWS